MKVIIDGRLLGTNKGGIATFFKPFLKQLISDFQDDQFVICGSENIQEFEFKNVSFIPFSKKKGKVGRIKEVFWSFPQLLKGQKGQVLISPYYDFKVPMVYKNRSLITVHDLCFWDVPEFYPKYSVVFHKMMLETNLKRVNRLITVSDYSSKRISEEFNFNKISRIYNTYDKKLAAHELDLSDEVTQKFRLDTESTYLLFTAGIDFRKNISMLQQIMEKFQETHPDIKLIFTGKSPEEDQLIDLPNVIYTGYVTNEELSYLYQKVAHVVLNLSHYEGFGRSNLEAMSYGAPLICSDIEVFREICGDYPVYVNQNNIKEIIKAIELEIEKPFTRDDFVIDTRFHFSVNYAEYKKAFLELKESAKQ